MKEKQPLISLCIPTYNRAVILEKTIKRIVSYDSFDSNVEIVISDNCSTDNTQAVCEQYAAKYDNVSYYRNQENTFDYNFIQALDRGKGAYLKLLNDWCYPTEEGLAKMKRFLSDNMNKHLPIFFTSGWARSKGAQTITCRHLDDYVSEVSVMVTFNNLFGAWRSDWEGIKDKQRFTSLKLSQVDWTYRIVSKSGALLLNEHSIALSPDMRNSVRQGYNYFEILFKNYYTIMQDYVSQSLLLPSTVEKDKKFFLKHFRPELFQALVCHTAKYWKFDTTGTWRILFKEYKYKPYFYVFVLTLPFQWFLHASVRDFGRSKV
jgi:glycosyltransferase involved in cell wall biosynthesis